MPGYKEDFLNGVTLPLPTYTPEIEGNVLIKTELKDGSKADYVNYTVVTNRIRRAPILVALNINQNKREITNDSGKWKIDSRIGAEYQLNNDYYKYNPWDRGHLARRASAAWGNSKREAQQASDDTFYYSNASIQHKNFNRDEWLQIEDWVLQLDLNDDGKITSFSGPIYGDFSRTIAPINREPASIPAGFFKIVCFINKETNNLDVRSFIVMQDEEAIADLSGRRMYNANVYQVTVTEIEERTGLQFNYDIYKKNPLLYRVDDEARDRLTISHFPERIDVTCPEDIVDERTPRPYFVNDSVDVFIAAAMVNPIGNERQNEWIAIINLSREKINLKDWTITDKKRNPLKLGNVLNNQERSLNVGESVVVTPLSPVQLSNDGASILLRDEENRHVDRVRYSKMDAKKEGYPVIFGYHMNR